MSTGESANAPQWIDRARDPAVPLRERYAAFAQLVEQWQHVVFARALASLRDVEEAKDAAQDTFTTAWLRLHQLRDVSVFPAWLKRIVASQCHRRLRRRRREPMPMDAPGSIETDVGHAGYQSLVARAVAALPQGERDVTVLFYFLGHTQEEIARLLHLKAGTVGKRLHSARLRIRRGLPPSVRGDFVRLAPSRTFLERVRQGLLDEYVGEYRFERRPDLVVSISRQGDSLVSLANNQRNVLASLADGSLLTSEYDGEGRFRRDRRGRVTGFVYYEFGRRLGIARKVSAAGGMPLPHGAGRPTGRIRP